MNAISPLEDKSNTDKLTIVCAIDFSDASEEAGKVAAALTSKLDGRLVLVHALENCTQEELQSANRPPAAVAAYKALVATAIELEAAGAGRRGENSCWSRRGRDLQHREGDERRSHYARVPSTAGEKLVQ